ncbi:MAG: hypothetical protein ACETWR_18030 [Anaerolineae bacterium]
MHPSLTGRPGVSFWGMLRGKGSPLAAKRRGDDGCTQSEMSAAEDGNIEE